MSFLLPSRLPADLAAELRKSCLVGGFDCSPVPTTIHLDGDRIELSRNLDESGYWLTPWDVGDGSRLMMTTTTLIEGATPYSAALELARGKLNQLRNAIAEWRSSGDCVPESFADELNAVSRKFARAVSESSAGEVESIANEVLAETCRLIDRFVPQIAEQQLQKRKQNQPRLDANLGCHLSHLPSLPAEFADTFNTVCVTMAWKDIEPTESNYSWEMTDTLLDWADANNLRVIAGPLIDFSGVGLPDWLSLWEGDVPNLANFMCDFVETVVGRYRNRIRRWHLTSGANLADFLNLNEDETLFLTAKLAETALHMAPNLELVVGVVQPWGEYLAREDFTYTPLVFLDQLLRAGLRLAAIDLELVPGVMPRGSYCRDMLELSRLLDHYSSLGTPIQLTLGFPSSADNDPMAHPDWTVTAGKWHGGYFDETQADWAERAALVALGQQFVSGVCWTHFSDAEPHRFPNCGLLDAKGRPKPALARLSRLRSLHLR